MTGSLSMQLWTEYEGYRIDGAFILEKLLLSEGRSAFFSTSNSNGLPTLIRLIASHFDEEEILARWRRVEALGHANILKIERYGQIVLDDTTMVYASFEPVDASLADVIVAQRLTVPETKQLALSLASALEVLHKNGFVHEHVEPAKVFAVGEVVKLRGDCIRETPEGELGQDAKKKDIHDLAKVILLALAQTETLEEATKVSSLPSPFVEIVRNGMNGTWGFGQILMALGASKPAEFVAPASRASGRPEKPKDIPAASTEPAFVQEALEPVEGRGKFVPPGQRPPIAVQDLDRRSGLSARWVALISLVVVIAFLLIWHRMHLRPTAKNATQESTMGSLPAVSSGSGQSTAAHAEAGRVPSAKPSPAHSTAVKSPLPPQQNVEAGGRDQWRVIVFTYNHSDQAQKKADTITQKYADLRPEVFTPTGSAPYLVTVGGVMSRDQAFAFVEQVRKLGLPHDSYAQNYSGKRP